jgi:hypothetical protein
LIRETYDTTKQAAEKYLERTCFDKEIVPELTAGRGNRPYRGLGN